MVLGFKVGKYVREEICSSTRVTQTVILAAGNGRRLAGVSDDVPKPLVSVGGQPLLVHALTQAAAAGCTDAVVVLKPDASAITDFLIQHRTTLRVRIVRNPVEGPNGLSLRVARAVAEPRFFLQMVDHIFTAPVLSRLVSVPGDVPEARVLVDRDPKHIDLDDATKVRLDGTRVVAIGKRLDRWDAVDAGYFLLTQHVFDALDDVPSSEPLTVSSGIRRLVRGHGIGAVDLNGVSWMDVDTPADRQHAEHRLGVTSA